MVEYIIWDCKAKKLPLTFTSSKTVVLNLFRNSDPFGFGVIVGCPLVLSKLH